MKRKLSPFVIALPAFSVLLIFKVWPFITSFPLSFTRFNPKLGISNSPFIGLSHYTDFFTSFYIGRLFLNTIILTLLPACVTCIVSFAAVWLISKLPNNWSRCLALSLIAIPAFIPTAVLIGAVKDSVDSDSVITSILFSMNFIEEKVNLLSLPSFYPWIYSVTETLKYMFYPIAVGVLFSYDAGSDYIHKVGRIISGYFLLRLAFMFVMNKEMTISLYNPMVYQAADTFNSFTFRKGLMEASYGYASAINNIKIIAQIILDFFLFFGLKRLFFHENMDFGTYIHKKTSMSLIIGVFGSILLCSGGIGIVYYLIPGAASDAMITTVLSNSNITQALVNSIAYSLFSALLLTAFSVFLAYPLTTKNKVYPLVLFMLLTVNGTIAEYFLYRSLGAIDSSLSAILPCGISVAGAFVLHFLTRNRTRDVASFRKYLRLAAPAIVIVFSLGFIIAWGSTDSMNYLLTRTKFPIALVLRETLVQEDLSRVFTEEYSAEQVTAIKSVLGIIGSLLPVIIGWVLIWSSKRIFLKKPAKADAEFVPSART